MSASDLPSPWIRAVAGALFVGVGALVALAAFDVGPLRATDINGPPWLAIAAGSIFVLGGVALWAGAAAGRRAWLSGAIAALMLVAFAAIGNWIAFGAGERACSGGLSGVLSLSWRAADVECRAAFGLGALMLDGMLLWALGAGLHAAGVPGRLPAWIEKAGQGLLLLALVPILLVLAVFAFGQALVERWRQRNDGA